MTELEKQIALYLAYELVGDDEKRKNKEQMETIANTIPYPEMAKDIVRIFGNFFLGLLPNEETLWNMRFR